MSEQLSEQVPNGFKFRFRLEDHVGSIIWLSWSPDGRTLASCSEDETIDLWDPEAGKLVKKFKHHKDAVSCITWSPDSTRLVSGSYDDSVVFVDCLSGEKIHVDRFANSRLNDLAWSRDEGLIAGAFNDGVVRIWDEKLFEPVATIQAAESGIYSIVWTGDGNFITSSLGGEIRLWSSRTREPLKVIDSASQAVFDLTFSEDNGLLAAGYDNGDIVLFEADGWKGRRTLRGHSEDVTCVRFSHDGRYLASKSFDDTVRLWDVDDGAEIARLQEPSQNYWLSGIAFHPKQLTLATLGEADAIIRVWDLEPSAIHVSSRRKRPRRSSRDEGRPVQFPPPAPPPELINALLGGECVLYVGAGLAAQAGLPTWNEFVQNLVEWGLARGAITDITADSLREALATGNAGQVADIVVTGINQKPDLQLQLNSYLAETFTGPQKLPENYSLISNSTFSAALTTNFDNLLERSYQKEGLNILTPHDTERLLSCLRAGELFVLKLFGTVERPETLMLSPAQYESSVSENIIFSQFMETLFVSKTLFFVGASLEGIEVYLKALKIGSSHISRQHFAFVNVIGNAWRVKADILQRRYGINVIPYSAGPGFPEVNAFLKTLIGQAGSLKAKELKQNRTPVLKSVELRNVGPFEELNLELSSNWNVLLGDNGVGKSTILKAIAIGLVGEDGRVFAERLIKAGLTNASISLRFEDEPDVSYITTISKSDSGAVVRTTPAMPLRIKGALSLGFPALRTISWDKGIETPSTGRDRASSEDLLPLIESKPDPRLDGLRTWLVGLDHIIQSSDTSDSIRQRYRNLQTRFFQVIETLTPGLKVEYVGVDPLSKRVNVRTQDGEVPIESVSQGTTSLLGWIGVFLQRYFDISGDEVTNTDNYALVLIDEIDAHMHPFWQQTLVSKLRALFPNVQFIATTHSPLLVPSLKSNEIIRLKRDTESNKIVIDLPGLNVENYRSDQILTSPLFGLQSSLSPEKEDQLRRYYELSTKESLTPEQDEEWFSLSQNLNLRLPDMDERREARIAYTMIKNSYEKEFEEMPKELQEKVTEEIRMQLLELITDSLRP
jgi:WD40 repeat protein/energy-coupling factor transporter ATP-binding protein EcfA2